MFGEQESTFIMRNKDIVLWDTWDKNEASFLSQSPAAARLSSHV